MSEEKRGPSDGAQDIDEYFFSENGVSVHIERMDKNEYMILINGVGDQSSLMFIGHWPGHPGKVDKRKTGKLLLNISESNVGSWHF